MIRCYVHWGKHLLEEKSANGERGGNINIVNLFNVAIIAHDQIYVR